MKTSQYILNAISKFIDILEMNEDELNDFILLYGEAIDNSKNELEYYDILKRIEVATICLYFRAEGVSSGSISVSFDKKFAENK